MLSLYGDHVCLLNKSIELILSSKDHIAVALLSTLMTLLLWLITPVRICLPHVTVYTAFYHYRQRKSMTFAPAGTIILSPSANIICIEILFWPDLFSSMFNCFDSLSRFCSDVCHLLICTFDAYFIKLFRIS